MGSDVDPADEAALYWWRPSDKINFGDYLSKVVVERMAHGRLPETPASLSSERQLLLAAGSILHFARDGDIIWGSGFREPPLLEPRRFRTLDVRAVRGPLSRDFLLQMGVACPAVYGDPALLLPQLCPELRAVDPDMDYVIIPNCGEMDYFRRYRHVIMPTEPWTAIVDAVRRSRFVIAGSLHGLIVAEAFGVPARLLKMTWIEPLLKYEDYYYATGRRRFTYATSVGEALEMGGERSPVFDLQPLIDSFPGLPGSPGRMPGDPRSTAGPSDDAALAYTMRDGSNEMTNTVDDLHERIAAAITPLHGWTTPEKGVRLAELVIETKADISVEIGVFGGRGTISMAIGHQSLGHGYVVGIDPWDVHASLEGKNDSANDEWWRKVDHDEIYEHCLSAVVHCGVARYVRLMRERSDSALRLFANESVSVLHQDGNHSTEISTAEVMMWEPKLARGGYWVADDADWATMQEALALLDRQGFELLEDHGGWRLYRKS